MTTPLDPPSELTAMLDHVAICGPCGTGDGCPTGVDLTSEWLGYEARQGDNGRPTSPH